MSDTIEPTPTEPNDPSISPEKKVEPKRKRSKLRWVWRGLGVFLVLILLLIVFAPKIASSGFARSFVLPKINSAIGGGELQISSWNFSWLGGQRVDGVRYLDENNALAIETNLVSGLSLWDAIRGDLNLKETRIDANVNLKVDSDSGKTNIDPVIKSKSKKDPEIILPKLKGNVTINLRGTIETTKNGVKGPAIFIEPSVIKLNITDINQPISIDSDLALNVDGNPAKMKLVGNADVIENQLIISDPSKISADMLATLQGLDLKIIEAIGPLIGLDKQQLAGIGNGTVQVKMSPGSPGAIKSDVAFDNFIAQLTNGDVIVSKRVLFPIDATIDGTSQQITITRAGIESDLGKVMVDGAFKLTSLDRLMKLEKPDAPGSIHARISVPEVAPVVAMLSNTIALRQGVVVQDGSFEEDLTISLLPDQGIRIEQSTNAQASGTLDEKSIELSPITSKLDATIALDGKPLGDDPMKELRRLLALTMDVRSAFVNVNATGNAGGLSAKTSFDLNKAREQLGQFIDFGGLYTSGTGTLNFDITGDLADKSKPITFKVTSDASNLTVTKNEQAFLKNEVLKFTTEGDALLATNETNVILRTLSLDTGSKLANINKVGNEPAKIVMKNGVVGGTGAFHVTADVARLAALSGNKGDESTKLESGFFDGTLTLASITEKRQYEIKLDGALTKVTLGEKLSNENVKLVGRFYAPDDMSKLSAWLDIYSSFGSIKITDTHVNLSKPDGTPLPTLEMLDTINVSGSSDQLAKVNALLLGLGAGDSSDVPPAKVESGKIAFGLVAKRNASDGSIDLKLDVPAISDLRVTRDGQRFAPNTPASASVKATVQIDPNKPDDVVASIKKIIVDSLDVNSFGIASIKMTEPIAITDPMGAPSAKGAVDVKGDLESLDKMLVVLTGSKSNELAGQANLNVKFASNDGAIRLTSAGQIDNFRSLSETGTKLAPQTLTLAGDINLDPTKQTAKINRFDLKTSDEQTLVMSMKGGITDWSKTQQLQGVELNLAYSMERLWKLVAPLVDPKGELQIEAVEGDFKDQIFKLSGNLSDMKTLNGGGKLKLARVYASGIDTRDIDLWITVKNGIVRFEDPKGAPTNDIVVNSGKLKLTGITIDLASNTISAPDGHKLMSNVQINPVLTNALGKITSVIFAKNSKADGRLDVTIASMKNLPLSELSKMKKGQGAKIQIDIRKLELDGLVPSLLAQAADLGGSIRGEVRGATLEFIDGRSISDLTITLFRSEREGDQALPMRFAGKIGLTDLKLSDYSISLSKKLIRWKELEKLPGEFLIIPVTGTASSPQLDPLGAFQKEIQNNLLRDPGSFLDGLFNKDKDKDEDKNSSDSKSNEKNSEDKKSDKKSDDKKKSDEKKKDKKSDDD